MRDRAMRMRELRRELPYVDTTADELLVASDAAMEGRDHGALFPAFAGVTADAMTNTRYRLDIIRAAILHKLATGSGSDE